MEERLRHYLNDLEKITEKGDHLSPDEKQKYREEALIQIGWFQHERLVHLIVTVLFSIMTLLSVFGFILFGQMSLLLLILLFMSLLIPYIRHYYILENGVQKLYTCYDKLK